MFFDLLEMFIYAVQVVWYSEGTVNISTTLLPMTLGLFKKTSEVISQKNNKTLHKFCLSTHIGKEKFYEDEDLLTYMNFEVCSLRQTSLNKLREIVQLQGTEELFAFMHSFHKAYEIYAQWRDSVKVCMFHV
jgi:hypothetical protein